MRVLCFIIWATTTLGLSLIGLEVLPVLWTESPLKAVALGSCISLTCIDLYGFWMARGRR